MDEIIEIAPLESVPRPEEIQVSPSCWRCHEDAEKKKLLCLCECREVRQTNTVIHVHCMEEMANTQNINYCPSCFAKYPLRRQRQTVSNLRNVHDAFLMIIVMLVIYLILGGLLILLVKGRNTHPLSIFMKIVAIFVYVLFILRQDIT
ncbi:E3 ubiquitin-protein ligase MARCH3-like [Camponotus floridanus]|uniref:E3 ubiquitin-protein ligase MARCH3-like n=1 Tax=Camponotus floridanus TaxID=104421 RepID=UPI000DC6BCCF|nr:E3 ubiquitin-protein ligase MARCH3-like [Camponotus floridanus]